MLAKLKTMLGALPKKYTYALLLLAAVLNPVFNHAGATVLRYFPNGNPLTLESIVYGAAAAVLLITLVIWFTCFHAVMTSDKLVCLFGRLIPALSLLLSMTLRFVPRFTEQARKIIAAQRCMGRTRSVRGSVTILSILVTWALENAVGTADSMKCRGHGLPGRTSFTLYRFYRRDRLALLWLVCCGAYILAGWLSGALHWQYYPTLALTVSGPYAGSVFFVQLLLCLTPFYPALAAVRRRCGREGTA